MGLASWQRAAMFGVAACDPRKAGGCSPGPPAAGRGRAAAGTPSPMPSCTLALVQAPSAARPPSARRRPPCGRAPPPASAQRRQARAPDRGRAPGRGLHLGHQPLLLLLPLRRRGLREGQAGALRQAPPVRHAGPPEATSSSAGHLRTASSLASMPPNPRPWLRWPAPLGPLKYHDRYGSCRAVPWPWHGACGMPACRGRAHARCHYAGVSGSSGLRFLGSELHLRVHGILPPRARCQPRMTALPRQSRPNDLRLHPRFKAPSQLSGWEQCAPHRLTGAALGAHTGSKPGCGRAQRCAAEIWPGRERSPCGALLSWPGCTAARKGAQRLVRICTMRGASGRCWGSSLRQACIRSWMASLHSSPTASGLRHLPSGVSPVVSSQRICGAQPQRLHLAGPAPMLPSWKRCSPRQNSSSPGCTYTAARAGPRAPPAGMLVRMGAGRLCWAAAQPG